MIDLYYWPTPNGHKVTLLLEEAELAYRLVPVNIGTGDQFKPEFLAISPNNRMPAMVDHAPLGGGEPISVFESAAILVYLAEKTGRFLPTDLRERKQVFEWLFWQMGGFGPMLGQNHHFTRYAPEKIPYAIERYQREAARLYGVLDKHLSGREFIAGNSLSIADMACHPWADICHWHHIDLADYPEVSRWHAAIKTRPAVMRAYARKEEFAKPTELSEEAKRNLFGPRPS